MEQKRAVVFSGGGAKGGYQIGVWKALNELGYHPDIVVGTSVGALNGALMAMDRYEEALSIWENMGMHRVFQQFADDADKEQTVAPKVAVKRLLKEFVSDKGGDYTPLQELVKGLMDEKKLRNAPISYGLVTTKLSANLEAQELFIEDIPQGEAADYVIASAACFPFMKSYKIGDTKFVDGGYSDNIPIEMALKKGATELVVVNIGGAIARQRKVPVCDAKIHYIHSRNGFATSGPASAVLFDGERSLMHIQQGYLDTMKVFDKLDGYAYTFEKNEIFSAHRLAYSCSHLFEKLFSGLPSVSRLEKNAQKKVLDVLNGMTEKPFLYNSSALVCLECAAEIFELDFLKIYTVDEICTDLLNALGAHQKSDISKPAELLEKAIGTEALSAAIIAMDKKTALCYSTQLLNETALSPVQKKYLWQIASMQPKSFCGAIFTAAAAQKEA